MGLLVVNNEEVESYRTNIHESGWVICEYIADTIELINYVQKLIIIVKEKSKRLNKRVEKILSMAKQNFIFPPISYNPKSVNTIWINI